MNFIKYIETFSASYRRQFKRGFGIYFWSTIFLVMDTVACSCQIWLTKFYLNGTLLEECGLQGDQKLAVDVYING